MVSDTTAKHNLKLARATLYCNSIVTLVCGLLVLIVSLLNVLHTHSATVKLHLCNNKTQAVLSQIPGAGATAVASKAMQRRHTWAGFPGDLLCNMHKGHRGHKTSCKTHADCDGTSKEMYCDSTFTCWECRFMDKKPGQIKTKCDAFDEDCSMCAATSGERSGTLSNMSTVVVTQDTPDGASLMSAASRLAIVFAIISMINALAGIFGDVATGCGGLCDCADKGPQAWLKLSRSLLFGHHFMNILLCICMLYSIGACFVIKQSSDSFVRSYWPWIRESFADETTINEAREMITDRLNTIAMVCAFLLVSLLCGTVASGRLLGLHVVTRHVLITTNCFTAIFGLAIQLATLNAAMGGYGWSPLILMGAVGTISAMLGCLGLVGVCGERPALLVWQFRANVPLAFFMLVLAFEALVWQPKEYVHTKIHSLQKEWGFISEKEAGTLMETHVDLLSLLAFISCTMMLVNLVCTRLLISHLVLGAQYHRVANMDMDEMGADDTSFEIGDDEEP